MKPMFDRTPGRREFDHHAHTAVAILTLLLGLSVGRADFTGDFSEAFWTKQPQAGSVDFTNSDTTLVLAGPNAPATSVPLSLDGILYGQLSGGLVVGGTVQFHWAYNSGGVESGEAALAWTPPGGGSSIQHPLNLLTGPGVIDSGDYTTPLLLAGTTFEFLLTTDTTAGKLNGTLTITSFQFNPEIPEPTTGALLGSVLLSLGAARLWRRRQPLSSQL